jgi:hypothetical protein
MTEPMDWQVEAERLRKVAGKLQDENDCLRFDLLEREGKIASAVERIIELGAEIDALRSRTAA